MYTELYLQQYNNTPMLGAPPSRSILASIIWKNVVANKEDR